MNGGSKREKYVVSRQFHSNYFNYFTNDETKTKYNVDFFFFHENLFSKCIWILFWIVFQASVQFITIQYYLLYRLQLIILLN